MQGNASRAVTGTATYRLIDSATTVGRVGGQCSVAESHPGPSTETGESNDVSNNFCLKRKYGRSIIRKEVAVNRATTTVGALATRAIILWKAFS